MSLVCGEAAQWEHYENKTMSGSMDIWMSRYDNSFVSVVVMLLWMNTSVYLMVEMGGSFIDVAKGMFLKGKY